MSDHDRSTLPDLPYTRIFVSSLVIITVYVGLTVWEAKQRSKALAEGQAIADAGQISTTITEEGKSVGEAKISSTTIEEADDDVLGIKLREAEQSFGEKAQALEEKSIEEFSIALDHAESRARKLMDDMTTRISGLAHSSQDDEWESVKSLSEDDGLSRTKASKGKRGLPSRPLNPKAPIYVPYSPSFPSFDIPEIAPDRPSPIKARKGKSGPTSRYFEPPKTPVYVPSSPPFDFLKFVPNGPSIDAFSPAHSAAEKGKNVLIEEKAIPPDWPKLGTNLYSPSFHGSYSPLFPGPDSPPFHGPYSPGPYGPPVDIEKHGFLPQAGQGTTLDEHTGGSDPHKVFRTTEDGVLHVDNNVNSANFNKANLFDSSIRKTVNKYVGQTLPDADVLDGSRPPQKAAAASEKGQPQSTVGRIGPLKTRLNSMSETKSHPRRKETLVQKRHTAIHLSMALSEVFVMLGCDPAWEAQQYINHACSDDPDETKTLKKQFIAAFLQWHKEHDNPDLNEEEILESMDGIPDIPVELPFRRTKVKNKTISEVPDIPVEASLMSTKVINKATPGMTIVKESKSGSDGPSQCMFFSKLPPEIRMLVYRRILTTTAVLHAGAEIQTLASSYSLTTDDNDPSHISNIDSALMRTCWKMYHETLPVLYGENKFAFKAPEELEAFREGSLAKKQGEIRVR